MLKPINPLDDEDYDDDGEPDVEHFPVPAGLLVAAGIESDEDWDALDEPDPPDVDTWAASRREPRP